MKKDDLKFYKDVIDNVDCPKKGCGAKAGKPCRTVSGRQLSLAFTHQDRKQAFKEYSKKAVEPKPAETVTEAPAAPPTEGLVTVNGVGGEITITNPNESVQLSPHWTPAYITDEAGKVAERIMGRSPEDMRERNKMVETVVGGINLSIQLLGQQAAIRRLAEDIVDGKTWLNDYIV